MHIPFCKQCQSRSAGFLSREYSILCTQQDKGKHVADISMHMNTVLQCAIYLLGWKFKISKILNFWNSNLKTWSCPLNIHNFKFKWPNVVRQTDYINQRSCYDLPNSAFWGWHSVESQPQNPEFRNNPENFHPCIYNKQENNNPTLNGIWIVSLEILGCLIQA